MDQVKQHYETPQIVAEFDLMANCGGSGAINQPNGYLLNELLTDPFSSENPFDLR